jgi:hypothetical protein
LVIKQERYFCGGGGGDGGGGIYWTFIPQLSSWIQAVKMPVDCSTCHALISCLDAMMLHKRLKHESDVEEDKYVDMADKSP